jgi:RNA polymerase sigma factor (sigma-70 family)
LERKKVEKIAIESLKNGNLDGLEILSGLYYHPAVKTAFLIVQSQTEAEDIVQDAFLQAVRKIQQCTDGNFKPWFHRIVINSAIKTVQMRKRLVPIDRSEEFLTDPQPTQQAAIEARELHCEIWHGISKLPARQRAALVLKYYLDKSDAEIAAGMKWPKSTVKWLLFSARKRLKVYLGTVLEDLQPAARSEVNQSEIKIGESR